MLTVLHTVVFPPCDRSTVYVIVHALSAITPDHDHPVPVIASPSNSDNVDARVPVNNAVACSSHDARGVTMRLSSMCIHTPDITPISSS